MKKIVTIVQVLSMSLLSSAELAAADLYIGDAAAEGNSVTAGSTHYSVNPLTIVMHTGAPTIYTAPSDQDLLLTEVNFYTTALAGTVTPFVALYDGDGSTSGDSYTILAIGDAIEVTAGAGLENHAFLVGGLAPTLSVSSGSQIVAGFLDEGKVVSLNNTDSGLADFIGSGNLLTSVGSVLSADSSYDFDNTMQFNVGFDVDTLQIATDEAAGTAEAPLNTFTASSSDLVQNGSAAVSSNTLSGGTFFGDTTNLGNGQLGDSGSGVYLGETYGGGHLPNTQTIVFDTSEYIDGYDITEITTYAGHSGNGSALANQKYTLEYRLVGSADFISLGEISHTPFENTDTNTAAATKVTITDSSGTIASSVDAIRITYLSHGFTNGIVSLDGTVYKEVDVVGTPVIPALELGDIWFVGDSITRSNADGDSSGSPRKSLYDLLEPENVNFTYTGHADNNVDGLPVTGSSTADNLYHYHSGISGIRIGDATDGMTQNLPTYWAGGRIATVKPEIILIMLGTNDVLGDVNAATAPARLSSLIDDIMSFSGIGTPTFFVSTIPPSERSTGDTERAAAFNADLPDIIAAQRIAGRDIYMVDAFTPLNDDYANTMRGDNVHPNATGNDIIGQMWYDAIMHRFDPEPGTDYTDWQVDNFGSTQATDSTQGGNPDGDSGDNFYEFIFGGDPNVADDNVRMSFGFDGDALRITRREPDSAGLVYALEESSTLAELSWEEVADGFVDVLSTDGAFESVEYTRSSGLIGSGRNFYRISVVEGP